MMGVLAQEWHRCRPWIEAALEHCRGTHTIEDVEAGLSTGHFVLWPGMRSAIITEIHQYPRQRFLHIFLAGGDMDELRSMARRVLAPYGFLMGCSRITLTGRKGWERALKSDGWQADMVCLGLPMESLHEQKRTDLPEHRTADPDSGMADQRS